MVFSISPFREELKIPTPSPFPEVVFVTVGLGDVLQQIPLDVTVAPPSFVMNPPLIAVVKAMSEIEFVVIVGKTGVEPLSSLEQDKKVKSTTKKMILFFFIFASFRCKTIKV